MEQNIQKAAKRIANGRISLILVFVLSILNIFLITFADRVFLFSSGFSQFLIFLGIDLSAEFGSNLFAVFFSLLAGASVVPYLMAYLFSKKRKGWMITGLILFGLDTLLLFGFMLLSGDFVGSAFDMVIHIWVLVELYLAAVNYGVIQEAEDNGFFEAQAEAAQAVKTMSETKRNLVITRKKAFTAALAKITVMIDGADMAELKNGETAVIPVDENSHTVSAKLGNMPCESVQYRLPEGTTDVTLTLYAKTGMTAAKIIIE